MNKDLVDEYRCDVIRRLNKLVEGYSKLDNYEYLEDYINYRRHILLNGLNRVSLKIKEFSLFYNLIERRIMEFRKDIELEFNIYNKFQSNKSSDVEYMIEELDMFVENDSVRELAKEKVYELLGENNRKKYYMKMANIREYVSKYMISSEISTLGCKKIAKKISNI